MLGEISGIPTRSQGCSTTVRFEGCFRAKEALEVSVFGMNEEGSMMGKRV
jgi:hypothetical protein